MLCRVRLRAIRSEILVRNCRTFSRLQNFAFEIARNGAQIHAEWWCAASLRSLELLNICCERQHAVLRAITCDSERISDRNFRKLCSRPPNLPFEIARDLAEIHAAWWCTASSRSLIVPNICCERQHAVPRAITCDYVRIGLGGPFIKYPTLGTSIWGRLYEVSTSWSAVATKPEIKNPTAPP